MDTMKTEGEIQYITPKISSHTLRFVVGDTEYTLAVLKMKDSFFLQIYEKSDSLDELSIAMLSYKDDLISSQIMGDVVGFGTQELGEKITSIIKKQIYVSCNIPIERFFRPLFEKALFETINKNLSLFE